MNLNFFDSDPNRKETNAKKYSPEIVPHGLIPMWIADTDFYCPQEITSALKEKAGLGHFGYSYNTYALEDSVVKWMVERFGWSIQREWVSYSTGVLNGMSFAVHTFSHPGDKIVIQTPLYQNFIRMVELGGRQAICESLELVNGRYEIDFDSLENSLSDSLVSMMLLCNPHNPTGRCFTREELRKIGELCLKYDVLIISDEIHQDIVFPECKHICIASISDEISNNCITFINPSKTFNVAGLYTAAWITQNPRLWQKLNNTQIAFKAICRNSFGELALTTAYEQCGYYADGLVRYLSKTRDFVSDFIKYKVNGVHLIWPEATYLYWLDFRDLGFDSHEILVHFLEQKAKLYLNSGVIYGEEGNQFMRMNVAMPLERIKTALEQLASAVNDF